jgi:hypothetical protein
LPLGGIEVRQDEGDLLLKFRAQRVHDALELGAGGSPR